MLTDRQKLILQIIVDDYVSTAEPVGSRSISKRGDVTFSPATIRNEMADLEDMGFLSQPHTSAGRIPSHQGYRYYVDHVMKPGRLSSRTVHKIKQMYDEQFVEFEEVIQQTAKVLSGLTNYTSIVLGPEVYDTTLKNIQLIPISENAAVAVIVTNTGYVENRKVTVPRGISVTDMEKLVNILNHKLCGIPFYQLSSRIYQEIERELKQHIFQYKEAMTLLEQALLSEKEDRVFLDGTTNIFLQPEFRDVDKVRELFELLEQHDRILSMLQHNYNSPGVHVRIGQENAEAAMMDCSIITASYSIGGRPVGSLNILGPTRMEYKKVVSILEFLTSDLNVTLGRLYDQD